MNMSSARRSLFLTLSALGVASGCSSFSHPLSCSQSRDQLAQIEIADQADRQGPPTQTPQEIATVSARDETRIKSVKKLAQHGCLVTGDDFAIASLVYLHGEKPEEYWQAYLWAKQADELGERTMKGREAVAIDRYLVSRGEEQIFATQIHRDRRGCWCLLPVDHDFSAKERKKFLKLTPQDEMRFLKSLNQLSRCGSRECSEKLRPPPRGIIPGIW